MKKILIFICFFLTGCAGLPERETLTFRGLKSKSFVLASWEKVEKPAKELHIYIEGDGFAWRDPYTPSSDPTPRNKMLLDFADKDKTPNVVYLARPCQYIVNEKCDVPYWTDKRFSPEVIESMADAVMFYIRKTKAENVTLVGYSGGATVAAGIAARVPEVDKLITIGGVLDWRAWTAYHGDSELTGSIEPSSYKDKIAKLPQIHYAGAKDKVVPPMLIQNFVDSLPASSDAKVVILPDASHGKGWEMPRFD